MYLVNCHRNFRWPRAGRILKRGVVRHSPIDICVIAGSFLPLLAGCVDKTADQSRSTETAAELNNDVSANISAIEQQEDAQMEAELRESDKLRRWQDRVRPTPKGAFPKIGTCYQTTVKQVLGRLGGPPDGDNGSAVLYGNGLYQVSYELVPEIVRSRHGDRVTMCITDLPKNCPPGDFRGIVYKTHNGRTGEDWELPDSEHDCGGA